MIPSDQSLFLSKTMYPDDYFWKIILSSSNDLIDAGTNPLNSLPGLYLVQTSLYQGVYTSWYNPKRRLN